MSRLSFKISAIILYISSTFAAKAQQQILQKAIDKIASVKNVSYKATQKGNNPLAGNDINSIIKVALFNRQADGGYAQYIVDNNGLFKQLDNGKQQVELNFKDSTYIIKPNRDINYNKGPLADLIFGLKFDFNRGAKTIQLSDSAINRELCYHLTVQWDSLEGKVYDHSDVYISKTRNLIIRYISRQQGEMLKGGLSLGLIQLTSAEEFSDYKLNNNRPPKIDVTIPTWFHPESKPLPPLSKGTTAPAWTLASTDGKSLSMTNLKGKVVFINFCSNGCAASALAIPSMKMLNKKYNNTDVAVLTINTEDSKNEVVKFMKKKDIKTPVYLNGRQAAKAYHVVGDPNFYLIDKQGAVSWGSRGYFEDFDNIVVKKIEALR